MYVSLFKLCLDWAVIGLKQKQFMEPYIQSKLIFVNAQCTQSQNELNYHATSTKMYQILVVAL